MAGHAIWKGNIVIGATELPVKLHTAVREEQVQLHLLHRRDHVRLRQQMICAYEKVPVSAEEQARGFALEEGRYILVAPDELERTEPGESRDILVHEFVKSEEIDPLFIERSYHLVAETASHRGRLLAEVIAEMGLTGICTWTMRKRAYWGAFQAQGAGLRLFTLRYADEVIPAQSLDLSEVPVGARELEIGIDLIGKLTEPFRPEEFSDDHLRKLLDLIAKKARGEKISAVRPRLVKPTKPDKLLESLVASLKKVA